MRLYKATDSRTDIYTINLYPTLFDDYLIMHHCGKRECPYKSTREYFPSKKEALLHSLGLIERKKREGFRFALPLSADNEEKKQRYHP